MAQHLDYPFRFDARRRTASASEEQYVRELIEQVLFTTPGERVNRPGFGSGLLQSVFGPNGEVLADATQFLVQSALQEWLGEILSVSRVEIRATDATLEVTVEWFLRRNEEPSSATFVRRVG